MAERYPSGPVLGTVPSSQPLQRSTSFVRFRVTRIDEIDDRDLGFVDEADWYAHVGIAGQRFRSAFIFGKDHWAFPAPNHPYTFLKAIPRTGLFPEPLVDLRVEVRTGDVGYAGTDDDVYLRINPTTRFQLDKKGHDDFERGDRQVYSAPIDAAVMNGITVGDIRSIGIEKSPDGSSGGWRLGGIKVWANGRLVYANDAIDRWLEDDKRTWTATDFEPAGRSTRVLPVWLRLLDDDGGLTFGDDHTDVSPYASRKDFAIAYDPLGPGLSREVVGGHLLAPDGDGDEAKFSFRLDTLVPQVASVALSTG